ncbi:MAG: TatD family hydrolase [Candidatus Niyogibacteria bacterium]|nr:TatD family hydrolase [Candidatus Niyogibacteria bacterium]
MLKPRLFDTHTHLQFKAFDKDREKVIKRALESGVFCVNVGTQKDTSKAAVELAEKYNGFWAAVGLHPIHTEESYHDEQETSGVGFKSREEVFDFDFYEKLASHPKVAAIGECGFDYYRTTPESRVKQEGAFRAQVRLAKKIGKPLMLHCRPSQNPDKSFSNAFRRRLANCRKISGLRILFVFYRRNHFRPAI